MPPISITLPAATLAAVRRHLLPPDGDCEEAAFLYARAVTGPGGTDFSVVDHDIIAPSGFVCRSSVYLELDDATRARVIKRAHDLGAALIETHSHPGFRPACFSWSDLHGFDEFVPHVLWRLPKRPYAAVVFAPGTIDALAWVSGPGKPAPVAAVRTETETVRPTGLTLGNWSDLYDRSPL